MFRLKAHRNLNRSKFILGIVTICLALVAVAATKVKQRSAIVGYYSVFGGRCIVTGPERCTPGSLPNCTFNNGVSLYFRNAVAPCSNPLSRAIP
jgi:hypothetical protein